MKFRVQEPSSRRVQAFIKSLYYERLKSFGYSDSNIEQLMTKYWTVATLLDKGKLACLLCHPWPSYCPDYDRGYDPCECHDSCDFNTDYRPQTIYDNYKVFHRHFNQVHKNDKIPQKHVW